PVLSSASSGAGPAKLVRSACPGEPQGPIGSFPRSFGRARGLRFLLLELGGSFKSLAREEDRATISRSVLTPRDSRCVPLQPPVFLGEASALFRQLNGVSILGVVAAAARAVQEVWTVLATDRVAGRLALRLHVDRS